MFHKVLVANRGEIAVRICRTLDALGIHSVAVYADADRDSSHVQAATEARALGAGGVAETYLHVQKLIQAARSAGVDAVHPGYGFLSENADFARALANHGIVFVGPRPEHLECFGLKHEARRLAAAAGVALLPGSGVLDDVAAGLEAASELGYPVMLKSSAGGGGIGMRRCDSPTDLARHFEAVQRLAGGAFGDSRLLLERCVDAPRHVEVQAFGDGRGGVAVLGDRDCSLQRRHQKVVEECPAPNVPLPVRNRMHASARALLASVAYSSAGTVEFLYDPKRQDATFLEVNTRLQVEHGVTELVYGVDLVAWMLRHAAGELPPLARLAEGLVPTGHAIQVRLCAEDPANDFRPTPGRLSVVSFPQVEGVRIDTWLRDDTDISPHYDSLLAKVMAHAPSRDAARTKLIDALDRSVLHGVETNRAFARQALGTEAFGNGCHHTGVLANMDYRPHSVEVLAPGAQTSIQSWPGRLGYWHVGVPPSGPMDDLAFRLGNRLLGNQEGAAGLEITVSGPTLAFRGPTRALVAGTVDVELESDAGMKPEAWQAFSVKAGDVLRVNQVTVGMRAYLLVAGGFDVPEVMGSATTFALGGIGGMNGRCLVAGDVLHFSPVGEPGARRLEHGTRRGEDGQLPDLDARRAVRVTLGPHCTEDFLTPAGLDAFFEARWEVHYHSSRTGVRLVGPTPRWAREDGGDAGLHPSNVHDNAYAFGAIDLTGDMPVILGPDGPSLGGFVCPAAVIEADRWKLGQLVAGDRIRLVPVAEDEARAAAADQELAIARGAPKLEATTVPMGRVRSTSARSQDAIIVRHDDVVVRRAAQDTVLVEVGPNVLDLGQRLRVHALESAIGEAQIPGLLETTAGIRSLLIRFDSRRWSASKLAQALQQPLERALTPAMRVASRTVHLPLSWDDPACRLAVERYQRGVRSDAPWCPDNIEFIRRINGLETIDAVRGIVFDAEYLVMGLGDVYLGAPVAAPVDPRHRLVTTKYNPARTWTAENSVGIGGAYLCIYGMEGPGGYQFVGRTLQVWNRVRRGAFEEHWLLRPFDRIRFHPVDAATLCDMRDAFPRGGLPLHVDDGEFDYANHQRVVNRHAAGIRAFETRRRAAFAAELEDWRARGLLNFEPAAQVDTGAVSTDASAFVSSPMAGSVWSVEVRPGARVKAGDVMFVIESMKAEFPVSAATSGRVDDVLVTKGQMVSAGQVLATSASRAQPSLA